MRSLLLLFVFLQVVSTTGIMSGVSTSIASYSDRRLKRNIRDVDTEGCLRAVSTLRLRDFEWHPARVNIHAQEGTQRGFIAQEVERVVPAAVTTSNGTESFKGKGEEELDVANVKLLSHGPLLVEVVGAVQALAQEQRMQARQLRTHRGLLEDQGVDSQDHGTRIQEHEKRMQEQEARAQEQEVRVRSLLRENEVLRRSHSTLEGRLAALEQLVLSSQRHD
jgi:hypothetical protein